MVGPDVPAGFQYRDEFISREEEALLDREIRLIQFATFEMRGIAARRRVAFFGASYDRSAGHAEPIPTFLTPLREQVARWAEVDPGAFAMALINEYRPGAPVGWHRDAPQYDVIAGVSLLSACRMKFRPYLRLGDAPSGHRRIATHQLVLEPRSAYLMTGESRSAYEHHVPPVDDLRYSITFRTLRR